MFAKLVLVTAAAAFVGILSANSDAWARGGKGGHGGGKGSAWGGKSMHGMHGKPGHHPHFPRHAHNSHGKHDHGHDHRLAQGVWHKASGKSDSGRNWQGGSSGGGSYGGGYGDSVGDVYINSQFCQGVWYQVTKSGTRPSESSATYQRNGQTDGK